MISPTTLSAALPTGPNLVGAQVQLRVKVNRHREPQTLWVSVAVLDHKRQFGRDVYLVQPVDGAGTMWVTRTKLRGTAPARNPSCPWSRAPRHPQLTAMATAGAGSTN